MMFNRLNNIRPHQSLEPYISMKAIHREDKASIELITISSNKVILYRHELPYGNERQMYDEAYKCLVKVSAHYRHQLEQQIKNWLLNKISNTLFNEFMKTGQVINNPMIGIDSPNIRAFVNEIDYQNTPLIQKGINELKHIKTFNESLLIIEDDFIPALLPTEDL